MGKRLLRKLLRQQQDQWFPEAPGVSARVWACPTRPAPPLGSMANCALPATPVQGPLPTASADRAALAALWVPASWYLEGEGPGPAGGRLEALGHRPHVWAMVSGRNPIISLQKSGDEGGWRQSPGAILLAFAGGHVVAHTILETTMQAPGSQTPGAWMDPLSSLITSSPMNQSPLSFSSDFVSTAWSWLQSQWRHPPEARARVPEFTWAARPQCPALSHQGCGRPLRSRWG